MIDERAKAQESAAPASVAARRSSARCAPSSTGATVRSAPPIDPAYDSGEGQDALERRYATRPGGLENAVFFESFYGRNASCNPLAIDRELARARHEVTRYWSVVDLSVAVPEGAIAVVDGSPEWWRARGSARLLVVNDWLRRRFSRRPGQVVLQTWHGTPLKRLALHRPGFDPRRMAAVVQRVAALERAARAEPLRRAHPRQGVRVPHAADLGRGISAQRRARRPATGRRSRAALGIRPEERVLLYAPTWRDDRAGDRRLRRSRRPRRGRRTRSSSCAGTPARCSRGGMPRARA